MRVAFVLYGNLDLLSGGFLYDRRLVAYLREQGDEVEVVSLPWPSYPIGLLANLSPLLARRLKRLRADVILQDELAHPSLFLLNRRLRRWWRGPVIALVQHLRSCEDHPPGLKLPYRLVEQAYLRSVDGFVYTSEAIRQEVENLGVKGRPGVVAYPGGDHLPLAITREEIVRRVQTAGPLQIAAVANLIPRKGLHHLVAALTRLPREVPWQLKVAGSLTADPAYVTRLERQIKTAGVEDRVTLLGPLDPVQVAALLKQSQVMAVPASFETLGIVFLEAMRAGVPVIASTAGGAREIVAHNREGFLVTPGDVASLTEYLNLLLTDRNRRLQMSLAAYERAKTHPVWEDGLGRARAFLLEVSSSLAFAERL